MAGKIKVQEILKCFLASLMIGLGISLFVASEMGADATTVFLDGMNRKTGIPVSAANQIIVGAVLVLALLLNRDAVGINTIIVVLFGGICVALPEKMISLWHVNEKGMHIRFASMVAAQLSMSAGYGWMQTFVSGMSGVDAFLYGIVKRTGVPYMAVRTFFDAGFLICGWLLGGIVGIGTIFSVLTMGTFTTAMKNIIIWMKRAKKEKV